MSTETKKEEGEEARVYFQDPKCIHLLFITIVFSQNLFFAEMRASVNVACIKNYAHGESCRE